jgi:hypothetical protein
MLAATAMRHFRQLTVVLFLILGRLLKRAFAALAIHPRCMRYGRKHQRKNHKQAYKNTFHAHYYKILPYIMQKLLKKGEDSSS